jgi:hypothetical protein
MTTATKAAPKQQVPKKLDPLDALAQGDPKQIIALMLWKARHREPDMYVQFEEKDIAAFEDCARYLKVTPEVRIRRPSGLPAQAAVPATHNRRAVPGREATGPKPYVIVTLVDRGTENVIRPVENNQEDYDTAQDAIVVRKARDQAPELAQRLVNQARTGEFSMSDMQDAADALLVLARSVQ